MKITRFKDIQAWQEALKLVNMVYDLIIKSPKFRKDFRMVSQLQDATEVQSHLYVALDRAYISPDDFQKVYNQAEVVSKMDSNFIKYLNSQPKKTNQPNKLNQLKCL